MASASTQGRGHRFPGPVVITPAASRAGSPAGLVDAITPYGYPSPLLSGPADRTRLGRILEAFRAARASAGWYRPSFRLHRAALPSTA